MATSLQQSELVDTPKWKLARRGIQLLLNNKSNEAATLFKQHPDSIQMCAGHAFTVFMVSHQRFFVTQRCTILVCLLGCTYDV